MSNGEFELLANHVCVSVLGTGTICFSDGPDGGRDGKFMGTANQFPSARSPWSGKFIIQAKWTHNQLASCSDKSFWGNKSSVLSKEITRIHRLRANGEVDNYLVFTNRKLSGEQESVIVNGLKEETSLDNVAILGLETITMHLEANANIATTCGLNRLTGPLRFNAEELKQVILAFHANHGVIPDGKSGRYDFTYLEMEDKNDRNRLGKAYFDLIKSRSEAYFGDIDTFLKNPINAELAEFYYDTADEFNNKLTLRRDRFEAFEEVFEVLYDGILARVPDLRPRRLITVFLHFMYCHCDIGEKC